VTADGKGPGGRGRPEAVGEALRRFLAQRGLDARVEQAGILDRWPELVGPAVAAVTRPLSVSGDGTLFVAVRTAAWMAELTLMERELLKVVNRGGSTEPILRIRWRLGS
jgi:predicted nucleic acid-binding Zn ribbon protein